MAVFVGSDIATFSPTCVFLDYILLLEKVELGEEQVTILPETYNKQQAQLTAVLGKLVVPKLASYKSIFHSLDHKDTTVYEEVHV
ncbi:MAG: hypothetical protein AAB462_02540 [Patescibacteria group bacterium]